MKLEKKTVLASITARINAIKDAPSFVISEATLKLQSSDLSAFIVAASKEKAEYDTLHAVSPLRVVVLQATIGALAHLSSEDEAREVARMAVSQWLTAKGLRSLSAAQVARLADGKPDTDDMPAHEVQAIARAYMAKDTEGAKLKSVNDILTHFKLSRTSAQAFALEQGALKTIANKPDMVAPDATPAPDAAKE